MNIEYMQIIEATPNLHPSKSSNRGLSVAEIINLETIYNGGNPFPKSYREFLFLAGKYSWFFTGGDELEILMRQCTRDIAYSQISVNRPFVVYDTNNGEGYNIIYLDEDTEDPKVHYLLAMPVNEMPTGEEVFSGPFEKFSEVVQKIITYRKQRFEELGN